MILGITDCLESEKFEQYASWITSFNQPLEIVRLSYEMKSPAEAGGIDGLLLTGGGDIDPELFGSIQERPRARGINRDRDLFEFEVFKNALDNELPVLGICRGMQLANVFLGGTLWIDLPSDGFEHHAEEKGRECRHPVATVPHSLLHAITGLRELAVNSSHHQAVNQLGQGLMKSAISRDGVTEAAEWALKDSMPFLLLVQWHPERLTDKENPASQKIGELFIHEMALRLGQSSRVS